MTISYPAFFCFSFLCFLCILVAVLPRHPDALGDFPPAMPCIVRRNGWTGVADAKIPMHEFKKLWPGLVIAGILAITLFLLHHQGRIPWCACGHWNIWAGDIWSAHNSQHVFDPYSFTHILHGVLFWCMLSWLWPRMPLAWRLTITVFLEALWEMSENSQFIIQRYREATISLGYNGDSIINSLADIVCCCIGFALAQYLGWRRSLILFFVMELILLLWIRDNLTLNILMLTHPIEAIKTWQMAH